MRSYTIKSRNRLFFDKKVTNRLNQLKANHNSIIAMNMAVGAGGLYMNFIYE